MLQLLQRQVIRFQRVPYRVLLVEPKKSAVWLFNLEEQGWPVRHSIPALSRDKDAGSGPELNDSWRTSVSELREGDICRAKRNFQIIAPLVGSYEPSEAFYRGDRCKALDQQAQHFGTSRQNVAALLKRYWRGGMTLYALIPLFRCRGGPGKKRYNASRPLGRPRKFNPQPKIIVDEAVAKIFDKGVKLLEADKKLTHVKVHQQIIQAHFMKTELSSDGIPTAVLQSPYPSLDQFTYHYKTSKPFAHRVRNRMSAREYQLSGRPITGRADEKVIGPGHRFQIDATIWDVYLVSSLDRRRIVGRPTVYLVIDEFSRLIVGFYVGFESPSWAAASLALINMVTPKVAFCRSIGIQITEDQWPAAVAPARLLADRGELFGLKVGERLETLNIVPDNTPPYRGDRKPIIESRFHILPAIFMPFVPGVVQKDWGTRGAADPRIEAAMAIGPFRKMLVEAILQHNREPISDYRPIPEMVTEGLVASPNNLWNWGVRNLSGAPKEVSVEEMSLAVLHESRARITPKGISFAGQYYSCPTAEARGWFSRLGGAKDCVVRFDSMRLSRIIVEHGEIVGGHEFADIIGLHPSAEREFSMAEFNDVSDENKRLLAIAGNELLSRRVIDGSTFAEAAEREKLATRLASDPKASKRSQLQNIRQNRAKEQQTIQSARGFHAAPPISREIAPDLIDAKETEYVNLLKKLRGD